MRLTLKNILTHNALLKVGSFILGFILWYITAQSHTTTVWIDAPVCLYEKPENMTIDVPPMIQVQLAGTRSSLQTVDTQQCAVHINAGQLKIGEHRLPVTRTTLLLPEQVNVVNYSPANAHISVRQQLPSAALS